MAINTLSNRSKTTFKHFTKKHDEKLCILKMCRKKLQVLQRKESMAKSVLIRNTLKIVETQQSISDSFFESDEEKENIYIDTLLRELDDYNNQMSSSNPISTLNESVTSLRSPQTELIEDFHNSSTFSCNWKCYPRSTLTTCFSWSWLPRHTSHAFEVRQIPVFRHA